MTQSICGWCGSVDTDTIIGGVALVIATLLGIVFWMVLAVRDRVGKADKKIDAQGQRVNRLVEWVENNTPRKRAK